MYYVACSREEVCCLKFQTCFIHGVGKACFVVPEIGWKFTTIKQRGSQPDLVGRLSVPSRNVACQQMTHQVFLCVGIKVKF